MKRFLIPILLGCSGCLFTEVEEIRIRPIEPGLTVAEVVHSFENISSGASDPEIQKEDFETLLDSGRARSSWKRT